MYTAPYLITISNSSQEVPDDKVDGDGDEEQPRHDQEVHAALQDVQARAVELLEASLHQGPANCREESEDRVDPAYLVRGHRPADGGPDNANIKIFSAPTGAQEVTLYVHTSVHVCYL